MLNMLWAPETVSVPTLEQLGEVFQGSNIKSVFDHYFKDHRFDRAFGARVARYVVGFEAKNEEHINFLGSNLLGVYKMKYLSSDEDEWIDTVLQQEDWGMLEESFHDLPSVNKEFNVAGSITNMSFVYAAHRCLTSTQMSQHEAGITAVLIFKMFHYKFLASLLNHNFPHRSQESIALALYESLSRKSLLKKHHTWQRLVEARSVDTVSPNGIHYKTLKQGLPDKMLIYVVTDTQSRIREVVKKLTSEYKRLREEDARVVSESRFIVTEGEHVLKEFTNNTEGLTRNMLEVVGDVHDYIRGELVENTLKLVPTADERLLRMTLTYMANHLHDKKSPDIAGMIRTLIIYMNEYRRRASKYDAGTVQMVLKLRNMYRSSQLSDKDILYVRDVMGDVVQNTLSNKHKSALTATRIASLVYLSLRILTYNHYQ